MNVISYWGVALPLNTPWIIQNFSIPTRSQFEKKILKKKIDCFKKKKMILLNYTNKCEYLKTFLYNSEVLKKKLSTTKRHEVTWWTTAPTLFIASPMTSAADRMQIGWTEDGSTELTALVDLTTDGETLRETIFSDVASKHDSASFCRSFKAAR